jgi:hypothetical protein
MTSTTPTRIITIALAVLALAAPAAVAMPLRDASGDIRTSSLAGTTAAPEQDLRNADNTAPRYVAPLKHPAPVAPAAVKPVVSTGGGGIAPLALIIPGVVLVAMLGAGVVYLRTSRPARGSVA